MGSSTDKLEVNPSRHSNCSTSLPGSPVSSAGGAGTLRCKERHCTLWGFLNQIEVLGAPTLTGPTGGQDAATRSRWSWELLSGPALGSQPCAPCLSARWISGVSAWLLLCRAWTRGWWLRRASRPQSKWTHGAVPLWEAATFSGCCKKRDMVGMCPQSHPSLVLGTVLPL